MSKSEDEKMLLVELRFIECYEEVSESSSPPTISSDLDKILDEDEEIVEIFNEWGMDYADMIHKWFDENSFENSMSSIKANLVAEYMISGPLSFAGGYENYARKTFLVNGQKHGVLAFLIPNEDPKHAVLHILFTKDEE
ncbi:MAG: hypothetical protein ACXABV_07285 [Candidatus Thorarchaeota archaeon]